MTKPFHAGRASESGIVAVQFASYDGTATDKILEAPRGFFSATDGGYDPAAIHGKLGAFWTVDSPGISAKPHPSGSLTHPGMTEMLRLIREHGIRAEDVEPVRVGTNSNMPNALIHHRPKNELQAKFSMEFCMAILLLEGRAGLKEFTDEIVLRPDAQAMIEKVDFVVDERAEAAGYHLMTTYIDIRLKDGRTNCVHLTIDGCIQLREELGERVRLIRSVSLRTRPLVLELTGKRAPATGGLAQTGGFQFPIASIGRWSMRSPPEIPTAHRRPSSAMSSAPRIVSVDTQRPG